MIDDFAGADRHRKLEWVEAGVEHFENGRAGGQTGEAIAAGLVGEGDAFGAFHGDTGVVQILAGGDILDPAGDRAGSLRRQCSRGSCSGADGGREDEGKAGDCSADGR